jgi:hypothetical protein
LFSIVAYFNDVKVNVLGSGSGIIIAVIKEIVLALVRQIDTKEIDLFKPQEESQKELFCIDWLDYNNITQEGTKYTPDDDDSHETFEDILWFLLNQFTPTQIKFAYTATISKLGQSAPASCNNIPNRKKDLIESFTNLIFDCLSIIGSDKKNIHR